MEKLLTFEELPKAVILLPNEIKELKQSLLQKREQRATTLHEQLFFVLEAQEYLTKKRLNHG